MVLLRAELHYYDTSDKDIALNEDILATNTASQRLWWLKTHHSFSNLPSETNTEPNSKVHYTHCSLASDF